MHLSSSLDNQSNWKTPCILKTESVYIEKGACPLSVFYMPILLYHDSWRFGPSFFDPCYTSALHMAHPQETLVEITWWCPWFKLPREVDHLPNIATVCLNYVKQSTKFRQGRKLPIPPGSEQREGLSCFQNAQTSCSKYWHLFASSLLLPMFANWPRISVFLPIIFPHRITSFRSWQFHRH